MDEYDYEHLKTSGLPDGVPEHEALGSLAAFIDDAGDRQDAEAVKKAIELLDSVLKGAISDDSRAHAHYFMGNAWAHLKELRIRADSDTLLWQDEPLGQEILSLRRAIAVGPAPPLQIPICQILTNLGNALSHIGRPVEAVEYFDGALAHEPMFSMATGNKGLALFHYAAALYDKNHACLVAKLAYPLLKEAADADVHKTARSRFTQATGQIENALDSDFLTRSDDLDSFSLGSTENERDYRHWCLKERLFLNPLNDATGCSVAALDPLTCPSIVSGLDEGPATTRSTIN